MSSLFSVEADGEDAKSDNHHQNENREDRRPLPSGNKSSDGVENEDDPVK